MFVRGYVCTLVIMAVLIVPAAFAEPNAPVAESNNLPLISHRVKSLTMNDIPIDMNDFAGEGTIWNKGGFGRFFLPEQIKGIGNLKLGKYPVRLVLEGDIYEANQSDQPFEHWQVELQEEMELNDLILELAKNSPDVQVGRRTEEIAKCFIKAIRNWNYGFLTEDKFAGLQQEIRNFAGQYLRGSMSDTEFRTLIAAIEKYGQPYVQNNDPASQKYTLEMGYLEFRDHVNTFKWLLWQALTREPQTAENVKRRNAQHKWLREYIKTTPVRPGDYVPEGIKREKIYEWAEDFLEQEFANPLSLMSEAMTDEQFEVFKALMKRSSQNGLSTVVSDITVRSIGACAHKHTDIEGAYQYPFDIELPFEDEVKAILGGRNSHLAFASNAQFCGSDVFLDARGRSILDVIKPSTLFVGFKTDDGGMEEILTQWANQHNSGGLSLSRRRCQGDCATRC